MESVYQGAIVSAIEIKYRNLGFYRAVAAKVSDNNARVLFGTLTNEESVHLEALCKLYQGDENKLEEILNRNEILDDPYYCSLLSSIEGASAEFDALQVALRQEKSCIEWFTVFADIFREPHIRSVFARVLEETYKRTDLILEASSRFMNVVGQGESIELRV
jgi:rubrerythrin